MSIVTDGLVLYLHGACGKNNPATRVWKDLSGNGNDGQLMNFNFTEDSGWVDGGLKFDGVDDYVQLPDLALNPDNFTIQVDDKIRAFNGDKVITENGDEWGRNLIKNSNFEDGFSVWRNTGEGEIIEDSRFGRVAKITITSPGGLYSPTQQVKTAGEDYTVSAWMKSDVPMKGYIGIDGSKVSNCKQVDLTPEWQYFSYTRKNSGFNAQARFYGESGTYYVALAKEEKGSHATPWTPAPEDITETNIINHTTPFVENNTVHTLRFYNRALTDEEILQNYQAGHEWTPQIGKREVTTTMKPITSELSRKGKGKRELISTMKPITTSLERKGKGKREVISTMKPITSELNRKGVGRREVTTTIKSITSSISKKLPPIHVDMDISERIPKLEVD